ncbi:hypothetical protein Y032_0457g1804 [Ancylostoma ceylanicum]|uniref:Secreted protein n=1 Tax=Ancylostoma ceylanicum TaxID=53326 RepID=A0A016X004_9BILA|nr:hypothetical protein Y032_0457g1804 [Ancylostoma ceylanicum]
MFIFLLELLCFMSKKTQILVVSVLFPIIASKRVERDLKCNQPANVSFQEKNSNSSQSRCISSNHQGLHVT